MNEVAKRMQEVLIKSSQRADGIFRVVRISLIVCIVVAYLYNMPWLNEIVLSSVILLLLLPNGWMNDFCKHLIEYNTVCLEERQRLNAIEANEHFEKAFNKIEELEIEIDDLKLRLEE